MKQPRNVLGRGLGALIPAAPTDAAPNGDSIQEISREYFYCPIEAIRPTGDQPRHAIDPDRLRELVDSIRAQGVIQPLVVRKEGDFYLLIAGERRWRAAQAAGLREVPVVVRDTPQKEAFELALVENLQREDLTPLEEAEAYARLQEEFGYTQEALAARVGKDRATIANSIRLLSLPPALKDMLQDGSLSAGHGRALLMIKDQELMKQAAREVVARGLSVRQTEALARRLKAQAERDAPPTPAFRDTPEIRSLVDELVRLFGTKVQIKDKGPKKGGRIEIEYNSYDELDRILEIFRKE